MTLFEAMKTIRDFISHRGGTVGVDKISVWHKDKHDVNTCYFDIKDFEGDLYVEIDECNNWDDFLFTDCNGKPPTLAQMLDSEWEVKIFESSVTTFANYSGNRKYDF